MDLLEIEFDCPMCNKQRKTLISRDKAKELTNRTKKIQEIFDPSIYNPTYREIFISNYCSDCQQAIFGSNDGIFDVDVKDNTNSIESAIQKMYSNE